MLSILTAGLILANVTAYPGFGDRGLISPRAIDQAPRVEAPHVQAPRVEASTDKGPILEIIVRCQSGTAIISYSKIDQKYCTPKLICGTSMAAIVAKSCN